MIHRRREMAYGILTLLVLALLFANLCSGSVSIPFGEVLRILGGRGGDPVFSDIVLQIRFPRALAAAVLGAPWLCPGICCRLFSTIPSRGPLSWGSPQGRSLWWPW